MSFSLDVKLDLLKFNNNDIISDKLELEAMLRLSGEVVISRPMKLQFSSNNMGIIRHLIGLAKRYYKIETEIYSKKVDKLDRHTVFTCEIVAGADEIIKELNLIGSGSSFKNGELTDGNMCAYLRGAFIAKGSCSDPKSKNSHLEIALSSESETLFIQKLMNNYELNARICKRKSNLIVYLKSRNTIADLLYRLHATSTMEYYEDMLIKKEIAATSIRSINLDLANQDKTNEAAREQLKWIQYLEYNYPLEQLDSKLLMVMKVRKENPEHSLSQLLDIIHDEYDPKLTKSGLNHRIRKLKELANELLEKKKNERK